MTRTPDHTLLSEAFRAPFGQLLERHPSELNALGNFLLEILCRTILPRTGNRESITTLHQWVLSYMVRWIPFDLVDFLLCEMEDVIADRIKMSRFMLYGQIISYLLVGSLGRTTREPGTALLMESVEEWSSSATTFPLYRPARLTDRRCGQRAQVPLTGILQQLTLEQHTQFSAEDERSGR